MKVLFVRPNMSPHRSSDALEPLVFGILSALTPPEIDRSLCDERLEEIPFDAPADLVAITVETFTARRAYQIASRFLQRGVPVVMGGYHPTLRPLEASQFASSVVVGDAEGVWPEILADARRGRLQRIYQRPLPPLAGLTVDRSIFRGKPYRSVALVQFGRGCRYACDFCSIHAFYGSSLRWRPVDEVVAEIDGVRNRHVFFTDDNLFNDRRQLELLLAAVSPLRIRWSCQTSLDVAADPELVGRMACAGCVAVMIGFESLDDGNLRQMKKLWQRRLGPYDELVQVFRRAGIMVYGAFVLGYDHDTPQTFRITLDFALRNKLFLANFNPLAPTPGAKLYDRLQSEGRLIHDPWWLHDDYRYGQSMFQPQQMTAEQLMQGCYQARSEFNRSRNIVRRALDRQANCRDLYRAAAFFAANITSRREIHNKQGRRLGDESPLIPRFETTEEGVLVHGVRG
jgi:radical SAM superfamily enzyme YgiQ (UPF0313 family)